MARGEPLNVERELLDAFEQSARVNDYLVRVLPRRLWRAEPPDGRGRSIMAIVAHMHGVRRTFANMGGAERVAPALARAGSTQMEARRALRQTSDALTALFRGHLASRKPRIKGMPRRVVNMMTYVMQHDAHHRGQISMLARQMGHRFSGDDIMRIWGWKKLP